MKELRIPFFIELLRWLLQNFHEVHWGTDSRYRILPGANQVNVCKLWFLVESYEEILSGKVESILFVHYLHCYIVLIMKQSCSFKSRFPASVRFIFRTVIYQVWIKFLVTIKQALICLAANAAKFFTSLTICWALGVIELRVNRYKSVKCLGVV